MNKTGEENVETQELPKPISTVLSSDRLIFGQFLFIELLSLLLLLISSCGGYIVLTGDFSDQLKGAVVMAGLVGGFIGVREYWLSSSAGSARKTEIIAERENADK